ncbi:biotin--[acetyl-CoA-carboxylase] ligase [Neorhodopirellula pilleata]|uniref:biotin--[biotin carboxyl-carrier protein] ligase n=1 Tax=Neorhodopirellula pilleata TaxID=2714738 RepID=A0A5C6AVT0_9BACT|nr:biotin--[acetyl-CoA-carboxylase] ligase [Neorhodopirellula pilleata]TWU03860.1 Bifunctional ligase/repressor BirA [Neorhodopirellula pilleata]
MTALNSKLQRAIQTLLQEGVLSSASHLASVDSTNTEAARWIQQISHSHPPSSLEKSLLPRLVVADEQTAGRGRMGRSWTARHDGLAFSLVWPGYHELTSIAVGVAIAETIEYLVGPTRCGLKWPNDVWMLEQKVAGVLIERVDQPKSETVIESKPLLIIGIGLNIGSSPRLDELATTSLVEATGRLISQAEVLAELVPRLIERLQELSGQTSDVVASFRSRCVLTSRGVRCVVDGQVVEGICRGIEDSGELLVQTPAGMQRCRSGEVTQVRLA